MMCGGLKQAEVANQEIQDLCNALRSDLEQKAERKFAEYTALKYSSQLVAGTNYFIKIHVGSDEYVHVRIFRPLPGQGDPSLHSFQGGKTHDDEVQYF